MLFVKLLIAWPFPHWYSSTELQALLECSSPRTPLFLTMPLGMELYSTPNKVSPSHTVSPLTQKGLRALLSYNLSSSGQNLWITHRTGRWRQCPLLLELHLCSRVGAWVGGVGIGLGLPLWCGASRLWVNWGRIIGLVFLAYHTWGRAATWAGRSPTVKLYPRLSWGERGHLLDYSPGVSAPQ